MRHFFLIDPLEKLLIDEDSSLCLANTLKDQGREVYLLFEKDLYFYNSKKTSFHAYPFQGKFSEATWLLEEMILQEKQDFFWQETDIIHMRIDPPFDSRYQHILWLLNSIHNKWKVSIINNPQGIMFFNEKLLAYEQNESCSTFVGTSLEVFKTFYLEKRNEGYEAIILKPLNLYQAKGVERIFFKCQKDEIENELEQQFLKKVEELGSPIVVQPYLKKVIEGETRAIFFYGQELASVIKHPPRGSYLANVATSEARCEKTHLSAAEKKICSKIAVNLAKFGIHWIAFDLIDGLISEVNVTCPGLISESSRAHQINLYKKMIEMGHW